MKVKLKKFSAALLSVIMMVTFMPQMAFTTFAADPGLQPNADGVYEIHNASELVAFREKATKSEVKAKLMNDIDMSGVTDYKPIGFENFEYNGVFDGNNKEIKNFNPDFTKNTTSTLYSSASIFGALGEKAEIKNIKNVTGTIKTAQVATGGIVGTSKGKIVNCKSSVTINQKNSDSKLRKIGGICGDVLGGSITQCGFDGKIEVTAEKLSVGGVVGNLSSGAELTSCYNHGDVKAVHTSSNSQAAKVGGIIGNSSCYNKVVSYCYNTGNVKSAGGQDVAGGLIGYSNIVATLSNSYNSGALTGTKIHGILGDKNKKRSIKYNQNGVENVFSTQGLETGAVAIESLNSDEYLSKLNAEGDGKDAELKFVKGKISPVLKWENFAGPVQEKVPVDSVKIEITSKGILKAVVEGKGGKTPTNVTYQWQKCTDDYWNELEEDMVTEYEDITGETKESLIINSEIKSKFNKYQVIVKGENGSYKEASIEYKEVAPAPEPSADEKYLENLVEKESGIAPLKPKFGKDTNAITFLTDYLKKKGYEGVEVTAIAKLEKAQYPYGGEEAKIEKDGTLTYFYADPFDIWKAPNNNATYKRYEVTFNLKKGNATKTFVKKIDLEWNAEKLKNTIDTEVLGKLTFDEIKDKNDKENNITKDLSLLRYFGGKASKHKNTTIKWKSSDKSVIDIKEPQGDTDTVIYAPLIGKVTRGENDKEVTLTATVTYGRCGDNDNDIPAIEAVKTLKKEFKLVVKGYDPTAGEKEKLQEKLEKVLSGDNKGLKNFITNEPLNLNDVKDDIRIPRPKDYGIDGKFKPVTVESSDENVIKPWYKQDGNLLPNTGSIRVYRPLPGEAAKDVNLTFKITDKETGAKASKTIKVTVKPLTQKELDSAKKFMENSVKAYYDGIKAENKDPKNITENLHAFIEIEDDGNGNPVFLYNQDTTKMSGVRPDTYVEKESIVGPQENGSDLQYRRFNSSEPLTIEHDGLKLVAENLEYDTPVTIDSYLNHCVYAKYFVKYRDTKDTEKAKIFESFYRQHAKADLVVKGKKGANPNPDAKIKVKFSIIDGKGNPWIKALAVTMPNKSTVGDLFEKVTKEYGYTYKGSTAYVSAITHPDGTTLKANAEGLPNSGWMYRVNGKLPDKTMQDMPLEDGSEVEIFYTKDYTKVLGVVTPKIKQGWKLEDNNWYYYKDDKKQKTGWFYDNDYKSWFYLNKDSGMMKTGWLKDGGKWYYLNKGGSMATGWKKVDGKWYYLNKGGSMATGWKKVDGKWYYLNKGGSMATGWKKFDDKWYYMNSSGAMKTGWLKLKNKWYYLSSSGAMQTGWYKVKGVWYLSNSSGVWIK